MLVQPNAFVHARNRESTRLGHVVHFTIVCAHTITTILFGYQNTRRTPVAFTGLNKVVFEDIEPLVGGVSASLD